MEDAGFSIALALELEIAVHAVPKVLSTSVGRHTWFWRFCNLEVGSEGTTHFYSLIQSTVIMDDVNLLWLLFKLHSTNIKWFE